MTSYQGWSGPKTLFVDPSKSDERSQDVTDGKSNTITVAEAENAVPWTKPDDLPFDADSDQRRSLSAGLDHTRAGSTPRSPTARSGSSRPRSTRGSSRP